MKKFLLTLFCFTFALCQADEDFFIELDNREWQLVAVTEVPIDDGKAPILAHIFCPVSYGEDISEIFTFFDVNRDDITQDALLEDFRNGNANLFAVDDVQFVYIDDKQTLFTFINVDDGYFFYAIGHCYTTMGRTFMSIYMDLNCEDPNELEEYWVPVLLENADYLPSLITE